MPRTGGVKVRRGPADDPARLVVLVHGYGEHIGRYAHVAEALVARGSAVVGPDHIGHGRSAGERVLVESFEPIVDDLRAVGQAYVADPLVYHGGWKRPTLEAFVAADQAIAAGPGFGDLPLLYVHGADDLLVPVALARPVVERLAGPNSELHVLAGMRHEVFNELGKEEVIDLVASFAERVTTP